MKAAMTIISLPHDILTKVLTMHLSSNSASVPIKRSSQFKAVKAVEEVKAV